MNDTYSTIEVARLLGMAVRSVQLMVDRGELEAWRTPGGHRRILRSSVERWRREREPAAGRGATAPAPLDDAATPARAAAAPVPARPRALLIEDSRHYQNLIALLLKRHLPELELHVAEDGIAGLAMAGSLQPQVLLVDILLPGIDGATLITSLRLHRQFAASRLVVVTSLDEAQREPYAFALEGVPVVHKTRLAAELPALVRQQLDAALAAAAA